MTILNYYEILKVKTNVTDKELKKAYRLLAKKYHPDTYQGNKSVAEAKMQEINVAYDTLSNKDLRKAYDKKFGINQVETANTYKTTTSSVAKEYKTGNYDKDGVNYEVKYRPNNSNIRYDSNGYAESNYYSYSEDEKYTKNFTSFKEKIKSLFRGKKLIYGVVFTLLAIIIFSWSVYKAGESINKVVVSTRSISDKINSSKIESQRTAEENEKELQENMEKTVSNLIVSIQKFLGTIVPE